MENTFIGIGRNPDGPDLPLGLGMALAQDPKASNAFASMSNAQKESMIRHITGGNTGEEAKTLIEDAVNMLHNNQIMF